MASSEMSIVVESFTLAMIGSASCASSLAIVTTSPRSARSRVIPGALVHAVVKTTASLCISTLGSAGSWSPCGWMISVVIEPASSADCGRSCTRLKFCVSLIPPVGSGYSWLIFQESPRRRCGMFPESSAVSIRQSCSRFLAMTAGAKYPIARSPSRLKACFSASVVAFSRPVSEMIRPSGATSARMTDSARARVTAASGWFAR